MKNKYTKKCGICEKEQSYCNKYALNKAIKTNSKCKSCGVRKQYLDNPAKNKGVANGRTGKKSIDVWISKYGEKEGKTKYASHLKNLNKFKNGEDNPSFGKIRNSGRSYKGWYKNIFFRSSLELMFLLCYEEKEESLPISAETELFRIKYELNGKLKTYVPDFYCIKSNTVYEIKPTYFIKDLEVLEKQKAFEKNSKFNYKIITERDIDIYEKLTSHSMIKNFIIELEKQKKIKFTEKTYRQIIQKI